MTNRTTIVTLRARDLRGVYVVCDDDLDAVPYRLFVLLKGREAPLVVDFSRSGPAYAAELLLQSAMATAAEQRRCPLVLTFSTDDESSAGLLAKRSEAP